MTDRMSLTLAQADPEVAAALDQETLRQHEGLEMIASENFVSEAVLEAAGSIFTNKYAEGYPGRRYYGGCEYADVVENLARDRAKQIFGARARQRAAALRLAGQRLGLRGGLAGGRHDSGPGPGARRPPDARAQAELQWQALPAHVLHRPARHGDDRLRRAGGDCRAREAEGHHRRRQRLSAAVGFCADEAIADKVGAVYVFDMAHIAGLVAGGVHPSPVPHAHITTTTTHKTLRGPRAGLILCGQALAAAVDKAVFPGQQGGPLVHIVAAKAVALGEALRPEFKSYAAQIVANAKVLAANAANGRIPHRLRRDG